MVEPWQEMLQDSPPAAGNQTVVQLFWDVAPLACENFVTLCGINHDTSGKERASPPPIGASWASL
jgi:hypothetical protein